MQTANALNNIIRILFNPKIEAFKLFDFLIVKSDDNRYLAQITEIYDDKFDSSQNVAKLKIFYKISENNEVMPYDNFTPNKECEITKIKQEEVENFINLDKETFIFATNSKNQMSLNIQYDFFNNNPVVLADKIECANTLSLNIAKKLSEKRHSVIIDSTGVIEHECAKKITANKDIKIPLNFSTIDFIFDRCLNNASLEFQATAGAIINEIKNFARKQTSGFIPFNAFLRVILEQYKATPYPELKVLIIKMKKYQMNEIFARYKKDVENLFKTIEKNPVTIIDISTVDVNWQKAYLEYLTDALDKEIYLITRINEENCDIDLINKIYNKKKNIGFIPMVSYNYKKLPSLIQYCKNYILLPTLYQRNDFLDANFALANLISNGCILFGENTDNFLYLAQDYELVAQEKRKNYKKIVISMINKDEQEELANQNLGKKGDYFENQKTDSQKLIDELSTLEEENNKKIEQETSSEEEFTQIENPQIEENKDSEDEFEDIIAKKPQEEAPIEPTKEKEPEIEEEIIETNSISLDDISNSAEVPEEKTEDETKETKAEENIEEEINDNFKDILEETKTPESSEKDDKDNDELVLIDDSSKETTKEEVNEKTEENKTEKLDDDVLEFSLDEEETKVPTSETTEDNKEQKDDTDDLVFSDESPDKKENNDELVLSNDNTEDEKIELSDEELDFFQLAQETNGSQENSEGLDLFQVAADSLDNSFKDIIDTKSATEEKQTINIDKDIKIDEKILESNEEKKENLPIFKEEIKEETSNEQKYEVGNKVFHANYGNGVVVKILKYEGRQLLQIDFEEAGKKTLEPRIANVKLVE